MSATLDETGIAAAAEVSARKFARLFRKPKNAVDPAGKQSTHRTIAIIATGGTFLCRANVKPRVPQYHKDLYDFITKSNLTEYFQRLGLYMENGKYYLPDGTEIVYKPLRPSIDSTNARYIERHMIATEVKNLQDAYADVDALVIHGTDTAAQTAQFLDLQFGRDADIGIAVVSSQEPADAIETDALDQFKTGFRALHEKIFRHVFVVSNKGTDIFSGISAKITDIWSAIFTGTLIGRADRGMITNLLKPDKILGKQPERVKIPALAMFAQAIIKKINPQDDGEQPIQMLNAADEIEANRTGKPERRYNAIAMHTAGSGNIPDYANCVLTASDNEIPVFALSDVPGAVTFDEDALPKYGVSAAAKAHELRLSNLILLPATRPGLDMRPSSIMALAATYARPRTPEFLALCHAFSAFAWTPEDHDERNMQIKGNRQQLIEFRQTLDDVYANLPASTLLPASVYNSYSPTGIQVPPLQMSGDTQVGQSIRLRNDAVESRERIVDYKKRTNTHFLFDPEHHILIDGDAFDERAARAFKNARVARMLTQFVPYLVDAEGHLMMEDTYNEDRNLITKRRLCVNPLYYGNTATNEQRPEPRRKSPERHAGVS